MPRYNNVRELSSGRWQGRYVGPDGRRYSKVFDSAQKAAEWVTSQKADISTSAWVSPFEGKTLFGVWLDHYHEIRLDVRPSTKARDESYCKTHIRPAFDHRPIAEITQQEVAQWVADLATKLKPSSVHSVYQVFSGIMTAAVDAKLIRVTPCYGIRLPTLHHEEMKFLTPHEIARLFEAMQQVAACRCRKPCRKHSAARFAALVLVGCYGGLRIGELAGLNRGHFDAATRRLKVEQQAIEVRGSLAIGPPKTRAGRRTIVLPKFVAEVLSDHLDKYVGPNDDDPIFCGADGGRLRVNNFRRREWAAATEAAGLSGLRIHDMRHTAVALWIATGAPVLQVSRQAGHSNVSFTLQRYGHLYDDAADELATGLDAILNEVMPARAAAGGGVAPVIPFRRVGQ